MKFLIILSMSLIGHFTLASITADSESKVEVYISDEEGRQKRVKELSENQEYLEYEIMLLEKQLKSFKKKAKLLKKWWLAPLYEENKKINAELLHMEQTGEVYVFDRKGGFEVLTGPNGKALEEHELSEYRQKRSEELNNNREYIGSKIMPLERDVKLLEEKAEVLKKWLAPLYEENKRIDAELLSMVNDKK